MSVQGGQGDLGQYQQCLLHSQREEGRGGFKARSPGPRVSLLPLQACLELSHCCPQTPQAPTTRNPLNCQIKHRTQICREIRSFCLEKILYPFKFRGCNISSTRTPLFPVLPILRGLVNAILHVPRARARVHSPWVSTSLKGMPYQPLGEGL